MSTTSKMKESKIPTVPTVPTITKHTPVCAMDIGERKQHKIDQFAALLNVRKTTLTTAELRRVFHMGKKTYIIDSWLFRHKFIISAGKGLWAVIKPK
jgi:hypothetical protein